MAETRNAVPDFRTNELTELCNANTESRRNEARTQMKMCNANTHTHAYKFNIHTKRCEYKFHIEKSLLQLVDFLTPYLPLVDSHTSDFITKDQWNMYIPAAIQGQLLHLSNDQLLLLPSGAVHWSPQSTRGTTLADHLPLGLFSPILSNLLCSPSSSSSSSSLYSSFSFVVFLFLNYGGLCLLHWLHHHYLLSIPRPTYHLHFSCYYTPQRPLSSPG